MANQVTLTFAGDAVPLTKSISTVNKSLDGINGHSKSAEESIGHFGDAAGKAGKTARGTKEIFEGLGKAAGLFGIDLPVDQISTAAGAIAGLGRGSRELSEGLKGGLGGVLDHVKGQFGLATKATKDMSGATKGMEGAQEGLNTVMEMNPIGLVIAAAVILAGSFYELYKHSETFRKAVGSLWSDFKTAFHGIADVAKSVADALFTPYRLAFDAIKAAWNDTVGGFGIPSVHILGFSTPGFTIPRMANGGSMNGLTLVGERGPELVSGHGTVIPAGDTSKIMGGSGRITIDFTGVTNDDLVRALQRGVRVRGGNAQKVLGSSF